MFLIFLISGDSSEGTLPVVYIIKFSCSLTKNVRSEGEV